VRARQAAQALHNLMAAYGALGRLPDAADAGGAALTLRTALFGRVSTPVARTCVNLALLAVRRGDLRDALACAGEATTTLEALPSQDIPEGLREQALRVYVAALVQLRHFAEAVPVAEQLLALLADATPQQQQQQPASRPISGAAAARRAADAAETRWTLARLHHALGAFEAAVDAYRQCLEQVSSSAAERHLDEVAHVLLLLQASDAAFRSSAADARIQGTRWRCDAVDSAMRLLGDAQCIQTAALAIGASADVPLVVNSAQYAVLDQLLWLPSSPPPSRVRAVLSAYLHACAAVVPAADARDMSTHSSSSSPAKASQDVRPSLLRAPGSAWSDDQDGVSAAAVAEEQSGLSERGLLPDAEAHAADDTRDEPSASMLHRFKRLFRRSSGEPASA
jgi:membrane protein required for beta-lactamase induction